MSNSFIIHDSFLQQLKIENDYDDDQCYKNEFNKVLINVDDQISKSRNKKQEINILNEIAELYSEWCDFSCSKKSIIFRLFQYAAQNVSNECCEKFSINNLQFSDKNNKENCLIYPESIRELVASMSYKIKSSRCFFILRGLINDANPAIRAIVAYQLPYLQDKKLVDELFNEFVLNDNDNDVKCACASVIGQICPKNVEMFKSFVKDNITMEAAIHSFPPFLNSDENLISLFFDANEKFPHTCSVEFSEFFVELTNEMILRILKVVQYSDELISIFPQIIEKIGAVDDAIPFLEKAMRNEKWRIRDSVLSQCSILAKKYPKEMCPILIQFAFDDVALVRKHSANALAIVVNNYSHSLKNIISKALIKGGWQQRLVLVYIMNEIGFHHHGSKSIIRRLSKDPVAIIRTSIATALQDTKYQKKFFPDGLDLC